MTQPTVVYFGADGGRTEPGLKVYLRTLLYATAARGCIVEGMFVRLQRGESRQNFNIWVYGEERLTRGSGLFIPLGGVTTNHHFLLPFDGTQFAFLQGTYNVEVFATVVGEKRPRLLASMRLTISADQAREVAKPERGLYFDWGPDTTDYQSHVRGIRGTEVSPPIVLPSEI